VRFHVRPQSGDVTNYFYHALQITHHSAGVNQ